MWTWKTDDQDPHAGVLELDENITPKGCRLELHLFERNGQVKGMWLIHDTGETLMHIHPSQA
jgi:hypothetical protein